MKIKELQKTVNVAWSPGQLNDIYLAAGTAAQQLDASPNTLSTIEIYSANLLDPNYDLELKGSQTSKYRFQKIIWSPTGINNGQNPNGLIVGGCEGGHIQIYSASKLLNNDLNTNKNDALIAHQDKHTGAVRGLDFNPFQHNLLASVSSESEIFIWDLNNTTTPMSPGTKTQPLEDIQNVTWNRQVQHILASVFSSKCVIWDLRKNEQIIKLSDSQSRVRWRAVQWHPDIATQLWLASEEDQSPLVQLWDLRYATAPAKTMQIHQRGILGLSWCPKDSDLMVSCGKDNKILCWNPNSESTEGEILSEIATTIQWYSDVQWCPRNPALICSSSFDGNVSIYSIFGGSQQQVQTSNKIADSFPGMDQLASAPHPQQTSNIIYSDLKKAPKWMKRPVGVSFGFGGRLLMFNNNKTSKVVNICQVVTEPNLVQRSNILEKIIDEGKFIEYCKQKADEMNDQHNRYIWYFIKANFEQNPRDEILNLLGYNREDVQNKFQKYIQDNNNQMTTGTHQVDQLTKQMSVLSHSDSSEVEADQSTDDSTDLSGGDNNALFDTIANENKISNENDFSAIEKITKPFKIPTGDGNESLICQAILTGNIEAATEICMECNRPAEALIIASTAGTELLHKIQKRYLNKNNNNDELLNIINALITNDWCNIANNCTIDSWKEALVAALIHNENQMAYLCDKIGERLQQELHNDKNLAKNSLLCYICAGNIEKLIDSWLLIRHSDQINNDQKKLNTDELQDLIEIVMLLKKSLEMRGQNFQPAGKLAELLAQYAGILATQGALNSALSYLGPSQDPELEDLRERLYYALGHKRQQILSRGSISQNQQQQQQQQTNLYGTQGAISNTATRYGQQRTNSFSNQSTVGFATSAANLQQWNTAPVQSPMPSWNTAPLQQSTQLPPPPAPTSFYNYDSSTPLPPPPSSTSSSGSGMMPTSQQPSAAFSKPPVGPPPAATPDGLSRPQRPSSVGSQGATPLTRAKYVLDPSVTSGPNYGQTMGVYNPQSSFNNSYGQFNNNNNNPPTSASFYQPSQIGSTITSMQNNFQSSLMPSATNPDYLSGIPPIETAQQVLPPPPMQSASSGMSGGIQRNPTPPPGWNDPPALKSRQQPKVEPPTHLNPITHPIFGVDPNQKQNGYPDSNLNYQNSQFQNQGTLPPPPTSASPAIGNMMSTGNTFPPPPSSSLTAAPTVDPGKIYNPMNFQQQQHQLQPQQQTQFYNPTQNIDQSSVMSSPPPPPLANTLLEASAANEKPPLPEEFIYMQTVFEELKNQCQNVAPDPRTKRKFVDVTKRLESLYDALRGNKLSQNTLSALNQIVQSIQIGDYQNAMNVYMQIVSGPDFSQTASFMPSIKVLVQSATELKVYLR